MKYFLLLMLASALAPWPAGAATVAGYIGTYTLADGKPNGSPGVYGFKWDDERGQFSDVRPVATTSNPSFLALSADGRHLYAANEDAAASGDDSVTALAVAADAAGALAVLDRVPAHGSAPCHLLLDRTGHWLFVANYLSGTVAVLPLQPDGRLGAAAQLIHLEGSGPVANRQGSAHAHEVVQTADGAHVLVADLGSDRVHVYRFDAHTGQLAAARQPAIALPPGSGPRHLVFSADHKLVYLVAELNTTLYTLKWNPRHETLSLLGSASTLPPGYSGEKSAAEISLAPSGRFLYVSNRGDANSIAVFRIGRDGMPVFAGTVPSGGTIPRFITIDPSGRFLIVANQGTGNLVAFRIDEADGSLTRVGEPVSVPAPVDVVFSAAGR